MAYCANASGQPDQYNRRIRHVCSSEAFGYLRGDRNRLAQRKWSFRQCIAKAPALDELHRDEGDALRLPDVVNRDDAWMIELRCGLRFLFEALQALAVACQFFRQNLDRDLTAEARCMTDLLANAKESCSRRSYASRWALDPHHRCAIRSISFFGHVFISVSSGLQ